MSAQDRAAWRPASTLLVVLLIGAVMSVGWATMGDAIGIFRIGPSVTGLAFAFAGIAIAEVVLLTRLEGLRRDVAADTSAYKGLMFVIAVGVLIALGFAATGTQFHVVPLNSAVTALGITAGVLTVTLGIILAGLRNPEGTETEAAPIDDGVMVGRPIVHVEAVEEAAHVLTIEGIGPRYATRLNAHGIITIPQLQRADASTVARQVDATTERVQQWQAMAELMDVKGIGPQTAEVLVHIGIMTIGALAASEAEDIVERVAAAEAKRKVRIQGTDVKAGTARRWIEAAQDHRRAVLGA